MPKKFLVELSANDRKKLMEVVSNGKNTARKIRNAHILLKADAGPHGPAWTDCRIAEAFEVRTRTVERIRQRLTEYGLDDALNRRKSTRRVNRRKLDCRAEAILKEVVSGEPPSGRRRWSMRLLAEKLVEMNVVKSVCRETVRVTLKRSHIRV